MNTYGELLDQGGTKKAVPAVWIRDNARKFYQWYKGHSRCGSKVKGRLEFKTEKGTRGQGTKMAIF